MKILVMVTACLVVMMMNHSNGTKMPDTANLHKEILAHRGDLLI